MRKTNPLTAAALTAGPLFFWASWLLMPGVGITDAAKILTLVSANPQRVLVSTLLQLISAALFALAVPDLARRFPAENRTWMRAGTALLAIGACGDAADAVYHQLAYEMARPGIDQAAVLQVMERMQSVDLLSVLPMILAFLLGCFSLAVGSAKEKIVPKANPLLYALAIAVALTGAIFGESSGLSARIVGLAGLACLSASMAWIGISLWRLQCES